MTTRHGLNYTLNLQDQSFSRGMNRAEQQVGSLDSKFNGLARTIGSAFAGQALYSLAEQTTELRAKLEGYTNMLKFASSNNAEFAKNQAFVNKQIKDFKLPLLETTEGYATFLAATKGTAIEGELARQVLQGMSAAQVTLHMSNEQSTRGLLALNQMISKGTVSSEELKGQLGEAIPGAFNLAAESIGVTTMQLNKMLEQGQVVAADFLPKFAAKLQEVYGPGMQAAINSTQAQLNEVNNRIIEQKAALGEELAPAYIEVQHLMADGIGLLKSSAHFIKENKVLIGSLATGYVTYRGTLLAASAAQKGMSLLMGASLGPIGLVALGLGAVATAVYGLAKNHDLLSEAINDRSVLAIVNEKEELQNMLSTLESNNLMQEERIRIYGVLEEKYPELFAGLKTEGKEIGAVTDKLRELIGTYDLKIKKQAESVLNQKYIDKQVSALEDISRIRQNKNKLEAELAKQYGPDFKNKIARGASDKNMNEWDYLQAKITGSENALNNKIREFREINKQQSEDLKNLNEAAKLIGAESASVLGSYEINPNASLVSPGKNPTTSSGKTKVTATATPGYAGASASNYQGVQVNGASGRGNTYNVLIQTMQAADTIVIEKTTQLKAEIERAVNEVLQRALADVRALD